MRTARIAIDAAMTALLPCLMAYSLIGETFHEVAGVAMLGLFIAHHILNRKVAWFPRRRRGNHATDQGLFRGRYSYAESRVFFFFEDYLVIMMLFATAGFAIGRLLKGRKRSVKK